LKETVVLEVFALAAVVTLLLMQKRMAALRQAQMRPVLLTQRHRR
jgi:hypothetical protein